MFPTGFPSSVYSATDSCLYFYWSLYCILAPGIRLGVQVFYMVNNMTRCLDLQKEVISCMMDSETAVG